MKYAKAEKLKIQPDPAEDRSIKQKRQKEITDIESIYYSGLNDIAAGEYKKAIETFSPLFSVTRIKKEGLLKYIEDALFQTAQCYYNLKDYEKSNKYYLNFINKAPHSPSYKTALLSIGENYEAVKNYSTAVKYYKKVIALPEIDSYRTKAIKALKRLALRSG